MADHSQAFRDQVVEGYTFKKDSILLGGAMLNGKPLDATQVKAPLSTFNRHGLVAGATGTGKTKTLQGICEKLSEKGVPVLIMDIKGDVSGLSQPGEGNAKLDERHHHIGSPWKAQGFPVELLSISDEPGVKLRATISEFGPVLLSKILQLNDTQAGVVSLLFKYCDDRKLPLLDIKDFRKTLQYLSDEGKEELEKEYGRISSASIGTIMRKLVALEEQGADKFFGERSFDVEDLTRSNDEGYGYINILRLTDIQSKPQLFSTFMLCLLAEIYETFPEQGDVEKPELVLFIDEAHLIFEEASKALLNQIETIIKLIRSKGIGVFFCTQNPDDVPASVLGQLGMKVQHALRAFTERDRKAIKAAAENYPISEYYNTSELLTKLGIGEALITVLNEKGIPTPLVHTLLTAPASRMDTISEKEIDTLVKGSRLVDKYGEIIDRESAYELLNKKLETGEAEEEAEARQEKEKKQKDTPSTFEKMVNSSAGRTVIREVTRGLLGVLGLSSTRRRSSRKSSGGLFDMFSIIATMFIFTISFSACQMSPSASDTAGGADSSSTNSTTATSSQVTATAPAKVQHMVCFKFKDGVTEAQKEQHMADFAALKDSIPEVKSYSGAYSFKVEYEKTADYDVMHIAGFDSEEDLETYFHHPAHKRFIERNKDSWANVIVVNSKE